MLELFRSLYIYKGSEMIVKDKDRFKINLFGIKINISSKKNYLKDKFFYNFDGQNNKLLVEKNNQLKEYHKKILGLNISIKGNNNRIIINEKTLKSFTNCSITINSNNSTIEIKETDRLNSLCIASCCGDNQKLYWGKNSNCWGVSVFLNEENSALIVGEDCMFSGGINIWTTDGHAIIDKKTNKIINHLKHETRIGDHVWIGAYATILKNAEIKNNSIIGASSVVTSSFDESNILIAGNPAKIIKKDVDWDRRTANLLEKETKQKENR